MADAPGMPDQQATVARTVVIRDYCIRYKGAQCARCEASCPKGAIAYGDEGLPLIDAQACTECGICWGICDGLSSSRVTIEDIHARVRRIALRGETVYFTCKEYVFPGFEPAANVIVLPCIACLSPEFWTLVLAENIKVVIACDFTYCADCDRAGEIAEALYSHAIPTAERWSGRKIGFAPEIPEKESLLGDLADPTGVDRRAAFDNLVGDVGDIASGKRRLRNSEVLQQFFERRERSRAIARLNINDNEAFNDFVPQGMTKKTMTPKRKLLLEAIDRDPEIAANIPFFFAETEEGLCENALACTDACPTGARYPDPDTEMLGMDIRYCIACGACVDACPHGAIGIVEATAAFLLDAAAQEAGPHDTAVQRPGTEPVDSNE